MGSARTSILKNSAKCKFICQRAEKQPGGASVDRGNGRQDDARPCFARRPVALLRRLRLDFGSPCFWFGLFCARCSRRSRNSLGAVTLTCPHGEIVLGVKIAARTAPN